MAAPTYIASKDAGTKRRFDRNTLPVWVAYGGIQSGTTTTKTIEYIHALCNIQGVDNIPTELINETTINALGKTVATVNDGERIPAFNVTVRGNDLATLYALIGLNSLDVKSPHLYKDHGMKGALLLMSFSPTSGALERTDMVLDVSVKVLEMPGGTVGSSTDQTVVFYGDESRKFTIPPGYAPAFEIWYDDGTTTNIVNTDAPDGTLTDFDLGTGNGSYATTINPAALAIEAYSGLTGFRQNFYYVRVNGVDQDPAVLSYSTTLTNRLAFTTAPADGAVLEACYLIDLATYSMPNERRDLLPLGGLYSDWAKLRATS